MRNGDKKWGLALLLCGVLGLGGHLYGGQPVQAAGNAPVQGLFAAGGYHSLALDPGGNLWGWGLNENGQLGDGTRAQRLLPFQGTLPAGMGNILQLAAGEDHSLALSEHGAVWAYGLNRDGQLGIGTLVDQSVMVEVKGLAHIVECGGGQSHSVALNRDGKVWAWGGNSFGELGRPPGAGSLVPVAVEGLQGIVSVSVGWRHTLALKKNGTVWEWGAVGPKRDGPSGGLASPRQVKGLPPVTMIAAGGGHNLALGKDGTVWAWGSNDYGQLGDGTTKAKWKPFQIQGVRRARQIFAGYNHSVALLEDDSALAWGDNNLGQLGNPIPEASSVPVKVSAWEGPLKSIETIRCGGHHTLFLTRAKEFLACGNNTFGQLGDWKLADSSIPTKVWKQLYAK